jgi:hypothetical protein
MARGGADGRRVSSSVEAGCHVPLAGACGSEGVYVVVISKMDIAQPWPPPLQGQEEGEGDARAGATVGLAHIMSAQKTFH